MDSSTHTKLDKVMEMLVRIQERLDALEEGQPPPKRLRRSSSSSSSSCSTVNRFQDVFADTIALLRLKVRVKAEFKMLDEQAGAQATLEAAWGNNGSSRVYLNVGRTMLCPVGGTHRIVPGQEKPGVCCQVFMEPAINGPGFKIGCGGHKNFKCDATMTHNGMQVAKTYTIADSEKLKGLVLDD